MRAIVIALTLVAALAVCRSSAAENKTTQRQLKTLEREVSALKAKLSKLTNAMTEVTELNRKSAEIWAHVLESPEAEQPPVRKPNKRAVARPKVARKARPAPATAVGTIRGSVSVPKGEPIAYVYVENVYAPPVRGKKVVIDQKNKRFIPSWAVVRRGTTIEFPNHDNIYHNVFSPSSGNAFDLGLYNSGAPPKAHAFQAPGSADVYCNIHPKMAASILVVPNGHFAKVKPDGSFIIRNVPSGQRKVVAWSPGSAQATQWVELAGDGSVEMDLKLQPKAGAHKNKLGRSYGSDP